MDYNTNIQKKRTNIIHGGVLDMEAKIKSLLSKLDFDGCLVLFDQLPAGNPMIDYVFDRMEELDPKRFEEFLG